MESVIGTAGTASSGRGMCGYDRPEPNDGRQDHCIACVTHLPLVQIESLRHNFSSFIHLALRIGGRRAATSLQLLPAAIYYTVSYIYIRISGRLCPVNGDH